jgi:hypothetical protein
VVKAIYKQKLITVQPNIAQLFQSYCQFDPSFFSLWQFRLQCFCSTLSYEKAIRSTHMKGMFGTKKSRCIVCNMNAENVMFIYIYIYNVKNENSL